jgi:hypothetical protein
VTDPVSAEIPEGVRDLRAEKLEEYGQFVATQQIHVGTALAYDEGHPVPVSNVQRFGYEDQGVVKRVASPANARLGLTDEQAKARDEAELKTAPPEENTDEPAAPPAPAKATGKAASTKGS